MLIRRKIVDTTDSVPPVIERDRTIVERDDTSAGIIALILGAVLIVGGLIGYYAWWAPAHDTVVITSTSSDSGRAQPLQSAPAPNNTTIINPPATVNPPTIVNTPPPVVNNPAPIINNPAPIIVNPPASSKTDTTPPPANNNGGDKSSSSGSATGG